VAWFLHYMTARRVELPLLLIGGLSESAWQRIYRLGRTRSGKL